MTKTTDGVTNLPVARVEPFQEDSANAYPTVTPSTVPTASATVYDGYQTTTAIPTNQGVAAVQAPTATVPNLQPAGQRNGNNNTAWYVIGGSIACTAITCCCLCFFLPLIIFLVVFFTTFSHANEVSSAFNDDNWQNFEDDFFNNDNFN